MSFFHYTLVGHFDPRTVSHRHLTCARPIDLGRVARLLAEYPEAVAARVSLQNGYAKCQWARGGDVNDEVFEFAYRLAREEECLAVENAKQVMYPPKAARIQGEEWEKLSGWAGVADELERAARAQGKELQRKQRRD